MTEEKNDQAAAERGLELLRAPNPGRWLCERNRAKIEEALNYTQIRGDVQVPLTFEPFVAAVAEDLLRDRATGKGDLWRAFQTSPETAMSFLIMAAQCKLLPGSKYGLIYPIPRTNRGRLEVVTQLGYRGLAVMSTRHPRVHSVEAFLVYEGETFDYDAGSGKLVHKVNLLAERTEEKCIGGYMRAIITEEATQHAVIDAPIIWPMSKAEIHKRRECSDAWRYAERTKRKDSPWHIWWAEMYRKTLMIGGLNHGSVPRDMGLGAIIESESEQDRPAPELPEPAGPAPSRTEQLKNRIGIADEGA